MSIEFLLGVGDGLGTVIVGVLVALVRSWNSGYLRDYLNSRQRETTGCEEVQNRSETSVRRRRIEGRVDNTDKKEEDTDQVIVVVYQDVRNTS